MERERVVRGARGRASEPKGVEHVVRGARGRAAEPKGVEHVVVVRGARGRAVKPKGVEHVVGEVVGSRAAEALAAGAEGPGSGLLPGRNREQSDGCRVYIRRMSLVLCGRVKVW